MTEASLQEKFSELSLLGMILAVLMSYLTLGNAHLSANLILFAPNWSKQL